MTTLYPITRKPASHWRKACIAAAVSLATLPAIAQETFKIGIVSFLSGQAAESFGVPAINGAKVLIVEVAYLHDHEWARSPDDVLWRRTKLGLTVAAGTASKLAGWFAAQSCKIEECA